MKHRITFRCCPSLLGEIKSVTRDSDILADVEIETIPLSCVQNFFNQNLALSAVNALPVETKQILIGGGCLQGLDLDTLKLSGNHVLSPTLCFYLIAPPSLVDELIAEGAYVLTPGWLMQWEQHLLELGFEREVARQFFQESISELVLLDTGVDKEVSSRLSALSEYLSLPCRIVPVNLDMLRLNLENLYLRIKRDQDKLASKDSYFAEHFMLIDQMNELLSSESETQAFSHIKEVFSRLFAPGRMAWIPREKAPSIPDNAEDSYWTESGRGFGILFRHKKEVLGIFELDDLAFEQYKERYLAIALPMARVCSMAIVNARATDERVRNQEALLRAARIVESSDDAIIGKTLDGVIISWNQGAKKICGYDCDQVIGKSTSFLIPGGCHDEMPHMLDLIRSGQPAGNFESVWKTRDEELLNVSIQVSPILNDEGKVVGASSIVRDITQEKQKIEKERASLNAQLQQSQKMESIGRLAGGVAHDYNNMLAVIMGYAEMALDKVMQEDPLYSDLMEIQSAAIRSSEITRQLLAFARKQTITPVALDLNNELKQLLKMLHRLIREDIDLAWHPQQGLWAVNLDPSQIDQILVNLCVNARDAIEGAGKITIELRNVTVDESYTADHLGFAPGDFVLLAFSDSGCGMDKVTLNQIFEPFFTTKSLGMGTGLGLSTVYGIVKQNNGFINVYSEPGNGSTFKLYFPRFFGKTAESCRVEDSEIPFGNGETLLVVEDEAATLKLIEKLLTPLNYRVLKARTPSEAIRVAKENGNCIDILITDVVMPEINGRQLYEQLKELIPGLKCLFMSGYTANVIVHRNMLEEGVNFLPKPFSRMDLVRKLRETQNEKSEENRPI